MLDSHSEPQAFARRGGHGHVFGDEGSAYHLGVIGVAELTNRYNCGEDLTDSQVSRSVCELAGTDLACNLPAVLVSQSRFVRACRHTE